MRTLCARLVVAMASSLLLAHVGGCAITDLALVTETEQPLAGREAVLILPGIAYEWEGELDIHRFAARLADEGYDVYVPNYGSRSTIDEGVAALDGFVRQHHLRHYGKLHVFAYILGGVTLNRYLQRWTLPNLASIVFDRGPLQERADIVATTHIPLLTSIVVGDVVADLAGSEPLAFTGDIPVGIIIENRATWFVRLYREETLELGPLSFAPAILEQPYTDFMHVWLDHNDMYHAFEIVGGEVATFFRTGRFSAAARKIPFEDDPFQW